MRFAIALVCGWLAAEVSQGKIVTGTIDYEHEGTKLQGYVAYDDAKEGKQPGVVIVHEWWGLNDFARQKAREVAELGYVAFALDMYGTGVVTDDPQEAGKLAGQFRQNPNLMRERTRAGYDVLAKHERVDAKRIAAIGFCFGGTTVLNMAYSGLPLAGVVSFHGGLTPPQSDDQGQIKARVLVLHGAADTHVPLEQVNEWQRAMGKTKADWQLIVYSDAKHSFTNPAADERGMEGVGYHKHAAERSWAHMKLFLKDAFAE